METLSRIENGKRSPNARNFRALMEKLDTGLDYYNAELDTDNFRLLEQNFELTRCMALFQWKEARKILDELKKGLDMRKTRNQRFIEIKDKCIQFQEKEISAEEFRRSCERFMDCQGERWREEDFWKQFFTLDKVKVINYLAK